MITEKCLVRHFLGIKESLKYGDLENVHWLPGPENPEGGMTKDESDMIPTLRLLELGTPYPGPRRLVNGVSSNERRGH